MSNLPPGWTWATLEELLAVEGRAITDGPFGSKLASRHYTPSGARVIRLQNIGDCIFNDEHAYISLDYFEELRAHEARAGDLVVASLGEELPRACLIPELGEPAIVKADCIRARIHPEIDPKWVLYALAAPRTRQYAASRIRGVGRPRLGLGEIRRIPIPLPPLTEQRRIVFALDDHLSQLDSGVSQLRRVIRRINNFRDQVMASACTGAFIGPMDGVAKKPSPAGTSDGTLPRIPPSWSWMRLGEIAEVVGGVTKDTKKQSDPSMPEVPYLRVANVQRGRLDLSEIARIRVSRETAKKLELHPGDVLLNEGGDRDKLGRGWIWEGQIPQCIHQNHVFRARISDDILKPSLLAWHANGFGRRWCEANGKQSVNLASISLSKIKLLPVPVPPRDQQDTLVAEAERHLTLLDRAERAALDALDRTFRLRRSLLAEAFAGRLALQDPKDEPASVLLERIGAQRAAEPRTRRGRGVVQPALQEETLL